MIQSSFSSVIQVSKSKQDPRLIWKVVIHTLLKVAVAAKLKVLAHPVWSGWLLEFDRMLSRVCK